MKKVPLSDAGAALLLRLLADSTSAPTDWS
jgi:hypothetical protein